MWKNCDCPIDSHTQIKYYVDDVHFSVKSTSSNTKLGQNPKLICHFKNNDGYKEFEIGSYTFDNNTYKLSKKYTMPYLQSSGIDLDMFSHFSIVSDGIPVFCAYPEDFPKEDGLSIDSSIIRAREALNCIRDTSDFFDEAIKSIKYINIKVKKYKSCTLPFFNDFTWYIIDNNDECFNLSSLEHLKNSDIYCKYLNDIESVYFGVGRNDRIYSLALKCKSQIPNPFSNAEDCTVKFYDNKDDTAYYAVGILLLDDGQYFCRLSIGEHFDKV